MILLWLGHSTVCAVVVLPLNAIKYNFIYQKKNQLTKY